MIWLPFKVIINERRQTMKNNSVLFNLCKMLGNKLIYSDSCLRRQGEEVRNGNELYNIIKEISGGYGYVHYLDVGNGFVGIYIYI